MVRTGGVFMMNFIEKGVKDKEKDQLLENIKLAHKQWKARELFFQEVTDPDLVDYAIYELEASKLKYYYLLKKIREEI